MCAILSCDSESGKNAHKETIPLFPAWIEASDATHKERVTVSWEEISNAAYYIIKRSENGRLGTYHEFPSLIPSAFFYDEDVAPGKTYYYSVKAVNRAGESVYGPTDYGSVKGVSVAETVARPSWVSATKGVWHDRVSLMWEDTGADSYNVYRKEKENGAYVLVAQHCPEQTVDDTTIDFRTRYLYKVEAVIGETSSEFSPPAEGYADTPSDLTPTEFYEILKPIIEHVWLIIDENNFIFPMTIPGAYGGHIFATMDGVFDSSETFIGSTVTLVFTDFNQDGHVANGVLTLDLDTILRGTETGTLYVTGAHSAEIDFHITIGPRPDGHSSELGGYYIITTGGLTESIDWRASDVPIVLYPPQNVQASDGDFFGYVRVSWDPSARAFNYKVFRSGNPYGTYSLIAQDVAVTTYNDYAVEAGTDYFYKIVACYGEIESQQSAWNKGNSGTVPAELSPPAGVSATDGTHGTYITITWLASTGADYYRVYRATGPDGPFSQVGNDITSLSYQDSAISVSTQYYYRVKAFNAAASMESDYSGYDSGYAGSLVGIPDAPAGVSATDKAANNKERVLVTWSAVSGATSYRVYRSLALNGGYSLISGSVTGMSYEDRSMHLDTVYYYRVTAVNSAGESSFSAADQGSRQITIDEFYHDIFTPPSKYAKDRIYVRFPHPNVGDEATFYGDNGGTMHFVVVLGGFDILKWDIWGRTTITYTNLSDGDLNKATTGPDEGGIILNGVITGKVYNKTGNGTQSGTLTVTGSHSATCEYNLIITNRITTGGYTRVTFNGETKDIPYINTDGQ
jgi:fibronectin type 3 domain-containing protein